MFLATHYAQIPTPAPQSIAIGKENCTFTNLIFQAESFTKTVSFLATSTRINLVVGSTNSNVTIQSIALLQQTSGNLIAQYPENNLYDTLNIDSLIVGQSYLLSISRTNKSNQGDFDLCMSEDKSYENGIISFTDFATGNVLGSCEYAYGGNFGFSFGTQFFPPLYNEQNFSCNTYTICTNRKICVDIDFPTLNDFIEGAKVSGPGTVIIEYNSNNTEVCFTFPTPGTYVMATSSYDNTTSDAPSSLDPSWPFNNYYVAEPPVSILPFTPPFAYNGDVQDYSTWVVTNISLPATLSDNPVCLGETVTLTPAQNHVLNRVIYEGNATPDPVEIYTTPATTTLGTHVIEYSTQLPGCPANFYTETFEVVETSLDVTISECGLANFDFFYCPKNTNGNVVINFGDGIIESCLYSNQGLYITHQYLDASIPHTWSLNFNSFPSSPGGFISNYFTQTGTFTSQAPANLTLNIESNLMPTYLCELTSPLITVTTPGLTNYNWTANYVNGPSSGGIPILPIIVGQSTNATNVTGWLADYNVFITVTATGPNGCVYKDTITVFGCCTSTASNNEWFETNYYSYANDLLPQFSNVTNAGLPNGLPTATTSGDVFVSRAINLPTAPALTSVIATSHTAPTTLQEFIAAYPSTWNSATNTLSLPSTWLYLNNDFIISSPTPLLVNIINSPFIRISSGKKILIGINIRLNVINSTFAPKCDQMWGGFDAGNSLSTLSFSNTNIIGAEVGAFVRNRVPINFSSTNFIDNNIGVQAINYSNGSLIKINSCYFGDKANRNMMVPFQNNTRSTAGISLNRVRNFFIGPNNPQSTLGGCIFHNIQNGIIGYLSSMETKQNLFLGISIQSSSLLDNTFDANPSVAIDFSATGTSGNIPVGLYSVKTTTSNILFPYSGNLFVTCNYGIKVKDRVSLYVQNAYMKDIRWRGISIENNGTRTMIIRNNHINSTNSRGFGIYVKNYVFGNLVIARNNFNNRNNAPNTSNSSGSNSITNSLRAIYVVGISATGDAQTTRIDSNVVNNSLVGIHIMNLNDCQVSLNTVNIHRTTEQINTLAPVYKGIWAQNSAKIKIRRNLIDKTTGAITSTMDVAKLQGINLESSPNSEVWKNRMNHMAAGFYALGSNQASDIECNIMFKNRNGFYLSTSDIGTQGAPVGGIYPAGYSASNEWQGNLSGAFRVDGLNLLGATNFYFHRNGGNFTSVPENLGQWIDAPLSGNPANSCGTATSLAPIILLSPSQKRDKAMARLVQNQVNYDSLDMNLKHYYHTSTYKQLQENNALITMGTVLDADYQSYQATHNIGSATQHLVAAENAIVASDLVLAVSENNALDANCTIFGNNKTINAILIQCATDSTTISASDSLVLQNIACLDPIVHGSAVYQARAILDSEGDCSYGTRSASFSNVDESLDDLSESNIIDKEEINLLIAPNPNNGSFKVFSKEDVAEVIVLDLSGKILFVSIDNNMKEINTNLQQGSYLVKVKLLSGFEKVLKIEVY